MKGQRQDVLSKIIASLLAMQIFLIGLQAKTQIDEGKSSLEALRWMIEQSIPVLVKLRSLQEKEDKQR